MIETETLARRQFLQALAGVCGSFYLNPMNSLAATEETYGQGSFRFRVVSGWGVLDEKTPVKDCHGMVQSRDGRVFLLTNHTANNVLIYHKDGRLLGKWGTEFPGAHGLTLFEEKGEERFFITDHDRHQVFKTTLDGRILMTLDWPEDSGKYAQAAQYKPTHVTVDSDGGFYVADGYGLNYIHQYDPHGKLVRTFGGGSPGPQTLKCAHGIHLDRRDPDNPTLLITSRSQHAIKRFSLAGEYLETTELPGAMPCFMIPWGEHLVVPHLKGATKPAGSNVENGFVSILDKNNRIVSNLAAEAPVYEDGKPRSMSASSALFRYPHGLMIDDEHCIYVAQWNSGNTYPIKLKPV